jgi:hypothetical protein
MKYVIFVHHFKKIKNNNLENSKHSKILYPTRLSHKEFNEHDKQKFETEQKFNEHEKSKFRDNLINILS